MDDVVDGGRRDVSRGRPVRRLRGEYLCAGGGGEQKKDVDGELEELDGRRGAKVERKRRHESDAESVGERERGGQGEGVFWNWTDLSVFVRVSVFLILFSKEQTNECRAEVYLLRKRCRRG